ncbi:MAG: AraC family transcriptional regulator [Bacteroidota bacterium]
MRKQGFIFSGTVLAVYKKRYRCLVFLALLVAAIAYSNFQYMLPEMGVITQQEMSLYLYVPVATLAPALILMFVKTFLEPEVPIHKWQWFIFFPFVSFYLADVYLRITTSSAYSPTKVFVWNLEEVFGVLMTFIVLIYSLKLTYTYRQKRLIGNKEVKRSVNWLRITLLLLLFTTLIWGYGTAQMVFFTTDWEWFAFLWIVMSFLIYWLGYAGRYKFELWLERKKIRQDATKTPKSDEKDTWENPHLKQLEKLMKEDKLYLDSQLSLESVAVQLGISPSHLSRLLNQEGNIGFAHYLNAFRVEEAIQLLGNASFNRYTMTAIGLESGFNSKSAFFRIFKEKTGQSPSAYQKNRLVQTQ